MVIDALIIANAYVLAAVIILADRAPAGYFTKLLVFVPIAVLVHCALNYRFGLYHMVGRYVGLHQALKIAQATAAAVVLLTVIGLQVMPASRLYAISMIPLGGLMLFVIAGGVRFYPRIFYERSLREVDSEANLLVVGAGNAGENIIRSIRREPASLLNVVALVDDDPKMQGLEIHGVPILGPTEAIPELVARKNVHEILIAIPSASAEQFRRIWRICSRCEIPVKIVDSLQRAGLGQAGIRGIREIRIEDVLGRQPVKTDYTQIRAFIQGKTVAVTGAGGSIGSELVMQISRHNPGLIVLVDQDETALYTMHERLKQHRFHDYRMFVANIQSENKLDAIFSETMPDIVFHAAAYKHVPLMELHPDEGVLNNIMGTLNVATVAGRHGVDSFVNISTDKAVEPINILGATKRMGERIVAGMEDLYPETLYCSVRFGNVLGSRGSVIPIFRQQILQGGPITLTDPRMTRYFMMISEAVDLVLQAASFREGNSIYLLNMGEPVKIVDLARNMIELMDPDDEIEIVYTGLRPGEKLNESLYELTEMQEPSAHEKINRISPYSWDEPVDFDRLEELFTAARVNDHAEIRSMLRKFILTYRPFDMATLSLVEDETPDRQVWARSPLRKGSRVTGIRLIGNRVTMAGSVGYRWSNEETVEDDRGWIRERPH